MAEELHPNDRTLVIEEWQKACSSGERFSLEYRLKRKDGLYRWFLGQALPLREPSGAITQWFGTVTDIDEMKRGQVAQAFLDRASLLFSSSVDFNTTLQAVADLATTELADWCGIDLLNAQGVLESAAVAHREPQMVSFARAFRARYPVDMESASGSVQVLRTGEPLLVPEISDEMLVQGAKDDTHLEMMRRLEMRSLLIVPLSNKGRSFGTVTFVLSHRERKYTADDVAMASELARRAAFAIENARILTELKEAVRARDEFLSIASHELRTPLTPIKLSIQRLGMMAGSAQAAGIPAEVVKSAVERSDRQLVRLTRLIDDLLDVARITAGKLTLNLETQDLAEVVRQASEYCSATGGQRRRRLERAGRRRRRAAVRSVAHRAGSRESHLQCTEVRAWKPGHRVNNGDGNGRRRLGERQRARDCQGEPGAHLRPLRARRSARHRRPWPGALHLAADRRRARRQAPRRERARTRSNLHLRARPP